MKRKRIIAVYAAAMIAMTSCTLKPMGEKEKTGGNDSKIATDTSIAQKNESQTETESTVADVDLRDENSKRIVYANILNQKVEGEFVSYEEFRNMENKDMLTDGIWGTTGLLLEGMLADGEKQNKIVSPMSAYITLAALREASNGDTKNSISKLMGVNSDTDISKDIYAFTRLLNNVVKDSAGTVTRNGMALSTGIFVQKDSKIKTDFLQKMTDFYLAEAANVDYKNPQEAESVINSWIKERSRGFMNGTYKADNPEALLNIINVFTVNGLWYEGFKENGTIPFKTAKGESKDVPSMEKMGINAFIYRGEKFTAYSDQVKDVGTVWFILPDEGVKPEEITGLKELVAKDPSDMEHVTLNLKMPLVTIEGSAYNLKKGLANTEYKSIFEKGADLSNMADGVFVSDFKQDTKMIIDAQGIRAGAVTDIQVAGQAMLKDFETVEMTFNRPYIVMIEQYNVPLFISYIGDPAEK